MKTKIKKLYNLFHSRRDVYAECYFDARSKRYAYRSVKKKYTLDLWGFNTKWGVQSMFYKVTKVKDDEKLEDIL